MSTVIVAPPIDTSTNFAARSGSPGPTIATTTVRGGDDKEPTACLVHGSHRRFYEHYCFWDDCCQHWRNQGPLVAKDFDHVPVCHEECWYFEMKRLKEEAALYGLDLSKWKSCHRGCYMTSLAADEWAVGELGAGERAAGEADGFDKTVAKQVVPNSRTFEERIGFHKIDHFCEKHGWGLRMPRHTFSAIFFLVPKWLVP